MAPRESSIILPTTPNGRADSAALLYCIIEANMTEYTTTWTTPNDGNITVNGFQNATTTPNDKFIAINAGVNTAVSTNETVNPQIDIVLVVGSLSYLDGGNYTCTVQVTDGEESGSIGSATVELILLCMLLFSFAAAEE